MFGYRIQRWEKATEWPLTLAALAFFAAYAIQIISRPGGILGEVTELIIWLTWAIFLVDYLARLILTEDRWRWFYRHLLDLAIVALPMLRPLRLMRFLTVVALVQRSAGNALRGRVVTYTIGAASLFVVIAALAILDAEQSEGTIDSFGEALWWAVVTMTTVGYGDLAPVTTGGRVIAAGLMLGGIALIGAVTATLASWIVEKVSTENGPTLNATSEQVNELRRELAEVKSLLLERTSVSAPEGAVREIENKKSAELR
ncbi:two pore domain potassium channel family protein [Leucobacter chromiireducens subsp. chromiireducens]|uniref:Two pore domain potassium channel family protein n=2 Tax=Leucobacter TaxID=55968 RepID=A0ABS1SNH7_9MICO|nr:potassium channel family protein [Leucobacter chromiireducens]MBL3689713.1 two pore domain potassium channel family protein [Leucobacter chromiireducens subsp. chromiireducens]